MVYVKVSIPILLFKTFTYSYHTTNLFIGQGVKVPFNNRVTKGFIISIDKTTNYKAKIYPIKEINLNSIQLTNELLETINWISKYYICPIGKVLKTTIPYQLFFTKYKSNNKNVTITKKGIQIVEKLKFVRQKQILNYLIDNISKPVELKTPLYFIRASFCT